MKTATRVVIGLAIILAAILVWGVLVEPRLIDREEEVAIIPNMPPAWAGQRIALIADLQVGMWLANTGTIERIAEELAEERPAAVLIAGDVVYGSGTDARAEIQTAIRLLQPLLSTDIPVFAVLGDHAYMLDPVRENTVKSEEAAALVHQALEEAGITVLKNEAVPLSRSDQPLYLVGLGVHSADESRPAVALAQVPATAARLVLMHQPESFAELPPHTAPLALAGHTHGGQIRVPFKPEWSWLALMRPGEVHADGWIEDYGAPGNQLYVNRGIGFSLIPMRVNCPPEVTFFTLQTTA